MQALNRFFQIVLTPLRLLLDLFGKIIPGLKGASRISTPLLTGILTFLFLMIVQITFLIVAYNMKEGAQFGNYMGRLWVSIPLIILTPFIVYFFVRLLLAGEKSPFPDVDSSWEAGLSALKENGIDIRSTPLFVVLGVRDAILPTRLMAASGRTFDVENVYGDTPSLQWFANEDEIYVFCRRAGTLSLLSQRIEKKADTGDTGNQFLGTILPSELSDPGSDRPNAPAYNVTAMPGQLESNEPRVAFGTGTLDASVAEQISSQDEAIDPPSKRHEPRVALSNQLLDEYEARLSHFCNLLNKARLPTCPINGVITSLGLNLIENQPDATANQTKTDLSVMLRELRVVCPVTCIVTDIDNDEGGMELSRRLGPKFKDRRFGKGNRIWNEPTTEQMRALSVHANGSFEMWVHKLFQDPNSLKTNEVFGNRQLFRLLCRCVVTLQPGLDTVLTNGFGVQSQDGYVEEHMKFGGCYFAGIGTTDDKQFFVRGVFDRIADSAGELEWTWEAEKAEERLRLFSNLSLVVGVAALATLIVLIVR